jgi:hypothetical protein
MEKEGTKLICPNGQMKTIVKQLYLKFQIVLRFSDGLFITLNNKYPLNLLPLDFVQSEI